MPSSLVFTFSTLETNPETVRGQKNDLFLKEAQMVIINQNQRI